MPSNSLPERLETDRLLIRVSRPGDGADFNTAILSSLDDLSPWLAWVTPPPTVEESELTCRKAYGRSLLNEDLMVFFYLKETGMLMGGGGLHDADWKARSFEVGYWCRSGYGRRGLMTEGVRALAEYALSELGANRVFLTCDEKNIKCWQLAERAGFYCEGTMLHESLNLQGELRDTRIYARTSKWRKSDTLIK